MDEIGEFMSRDHRKIDALLARLRAGPSLPGEAARALEAFRAALEKHMVWEETIFFPALVSKAGDAAEPSAETMRLQHDELRRQIKDLQASLAQERQDRRGLEEVLVESLGEHNTEEEGYVYPWVDAVLDPGEKEALLRPLRGGAGSGPERINVL